jgi:cold shock CspA family protein
VQPRGPEAATVPSPVSPVPSTQDSSDGWRLGVVDRFDQAAWSGTISVAGSGGNEEFPIAAGALRRAGLTNLFGGQRVEFRVISGAGGRREADHLKLVVARGRVAGAPGLAGISDNPVSKRYFGMPR